MPRGRGRQLSTEIEGRGMDSQYRRLEATNERLLKFLRIRIIRVNWTKKVNCLEGLEGIDYHFTMGNLTRSS